MKTKKIAENIKNFFKTNISLKIFSLIFAFVMWFIVLSTLNPSETKSYTVNLTVNGAEDLEANDLICMNLDSLKSQNVRIKIKATRPDLNELDSNKDKLTASVDLGRFADYYYQDLSESPVVSVIPNLSVYSNAYEIVGYSPSSLTVKLDRLVEFEVPTRVIVQNEPEESYVRNEPVAAVSSVTVKGPESLKDQISYAGLIIDLSQVTGDNVANAEPVLFDTEGNVISDDYFTVYEEYVQVSTSVLRQGEIGVELSEYVGTAASGYSVTDVIYSPRTIKVLGADIPSEPIVLPAVSISGADENVTAEFDIQELLAEKGLMAATDEYLKVSVEIVIEREEPTVVKIDGSAISAVNLAEGYYLESEPGSVSFELYGNKDLIDSSDISAYIDLEGYTAGNYRVQVYPVLPSGIIAVENEYIYIEIAAETLDSLNPAASEESSSEETTSEEAAEEETTENETADDEEEDN